ncbi:hypothetical protein FJTKL_00213 [Diaporthe vaccinii]|uniref:Ankyrin repeat protein n=1 Tax=Diaporthe vaccinii TaxID=105482 RepID=A0ABR4E3S9_9PEZI
MGVSEDVLACVVSAPANNHHGAVQWVEHAMARYHNEDGEGIVENRVKTNKTLSREFWKGQLHGSGPGRNPIHATHMRSRCSIIPGETQSLVVEQKQNSTTHKDMAVFMPYLHWETSARRARMAKAVKAILKEEEAKNAKSKYRTKRSATLRQDIDKKYKNLFQTQEQKHREMASKMMKKTSQPTKLGKYLMCLAQLWDAMDMEPDERLVRYGLTSPATNGKPLEPLLHIRRTLDQSYFLNLKDTSQRDQDQVVYRATQGHGNLTRVVMVDQLWLWVLDEHTVITSFPKRWGRNKPDSSGIHKSLRVRLDQPGFKVMSAWHLAFIIIDQCSNVFFDRTQPLDLRPEVMDIFAETLGDVNHYTTIAFKVFWHSVEEFSQSRDTRGSNRQNQKYLDINPEGTLLREAQDIAEELRIMNGIFSQQLGVVKSFQKSQNEGPISAAEMDFLEDLIEEVENRKSEIVDLENAALQTCQQLQDLLSLKQQQASIVEAKAAIERADQSVAQGKAIMAFTIMTIIFTPLGFFTSFFGMNNSFTGADWMTLGRQCLYMFSISAAIILIALSLALKTQIRNFLKSPKGPKAKWHALKAWWPGKLRKADDKTNGNADEGQSSGTNASKYYQVSLGRMARRNNYSRNDVESSRPEHECTTVRSKTTDC